MLKESDLIYFVNIWIVLVFYYDDDILKVKMYSCAQKCRIILVAT